jgi:hypothetical protein
MTVLLRSFELRVAALFALAFGVGFAVSIAACGSSSAPAGFAGTDAGSAGDGASAGGDGCTSCVTDQDCNGGVCAQIGGDSYCTALCPNGNECTAATSCIQVVSVAGTQESACVPANDCGGMSQGNEDAGAPPTNTCGSLNGPDVASGCTCSSGKTCSANGCYGGWWCNTQSNKCQAPPDPSSCPGAGGTLPDGGPITGTVTVTGGSVSRLLFAVVGDTRPPTEDDVNGYPTSVITGLYTDIQALSPTPSFVVSTGDYQFSNPSGSSASAQLDLYLTARSNFKGVSFPAMGNHECTGGTTSNCGTGNTNGITNNYSAFMSKMLQPLGVSAPYYEVDINATDMSWTAKYLFVAANAWDNSQASWLTTAMAKTTTYTFVIRHESATTSPGPPGIAGSEAIMAKYPYTLSIVGHTHTYYHGNGSREVLVGNGGAPLSSKNYGFGLIQQRSDGAIVGDMINATTKQTDTLFHFVVKPDGTSTN